ncbi:hypothetical protein ACQPYK_21610 [Streptosporangium sp. CA-135522]|uniref:hypothetical protein n=1 Tax=Streptosporangium sp. CA-135522 TaxID=3240072 RepID=UPI003D8A4242
MPGTLSYGTDNHPMPGKVSQRLSACDAMFNWSMLLSRRLHFETLSNELVRDSDSMVRGVEARQDSVM